MGIFDPEGTIRVLPAAAMALFGAVTGQALRNTSTPTARLAGMIALTGVVGVISGLMLGQIVPVIKPLWSSSYIVLSAGWSLILLALFYLLVDVWKQRWLAFPFLPLGMNAITIYVAAHYIDFKFTSSFFFGGLTQFDAEFGKVAITGGVLLVEWLLLYFLYRKKIFLRV
jgi:predicted acyltransferase